MKKEYQSIPFIILCLLLNIQRSAAQDKWEMIVNLKGNWKFAIGDNKRWTEPDFSDREWENILVPSNWEDEGFNGYNGHAWYRKTFEGSALNNSKWTFDLFLGYIDDVDEVYLNGHKIGGSGSFPPKYHTAYNASRKYHMPGEYINFNGKNVIAVRVYDAEHYGGIVSGQVGIFTNKDDEDLAINLRGIWDFKITGRNEGYQEFDKSYLLNLSQSANEEKDNNGKRWVNITVPGVWEHQGFNDYNGSAWYRKTFTIPASLKGEDLILMLGKIDDYDKTYLNGKLVGTTNHYNKLRIYNITSDMFNSGTNTLLIYVNDPQGYGGIYDSPIGLMKQSDFTRYFRWRK